MPELIFSDQLPSGMQYAFQPALFNQLNYLYKLTKGPYKSFFIVNENNKTLVGQIHFNIHDTTAMSLSQALFGSFEFVKTLPEEAIAAFINYVTDQLEYENIKRIEIIHPAEIYSQEQNDLIVKSLEENGYEKTLTYKNHYIPIDSSSLEDKMHLMEKRKLQKCRDNGLKFTCEPIEHLDKIYDFIEQSRDEKSIPLSMSKDKLRKSFELFPENYFLCNVKDNDNICAATVTVKIVDHILYNFLPSSSAAYNHISPAVMLYEGLYQYCQENNYQHLDLGISTLPDGTDQEGLIAFKENIGGVESYKYKFRKMMT